MNVRSDATSTNASVQVWRAVAKDVLYSTASPSEMRSVAVLTVAVVAAVAVATPLEQRAAAYYAPSAGALRVLSSASA
jgi:hypothetical protein